MALRARKGSGAFQRGFPQSLNRDQVFTGFAFFYDRDVIPTISAIRMIPEYDLRNSLLML